MYVSCLPVASSYIFAVVSLVQKANDGDDVTRLLKETITVQEEEINFLQKSVMKQVELSAMLQKKQATLEKDLATAEEQVCPCVHASMRSCPCVRASVHPWAQEAKRGRERECACGWVHMCMYNMYIYDVHHTCWPTSCTPSCAPLLCVHGVLVPLYSSTGDLVSCGAC